MEMFHFRISACTGTELVLKTLIHGGCWHFKFENMWLAIVGFVDKVRLWWSSYMFKGTPIFILASKLKVLKHDLMKCDLKVFGNVESLKNSLMEEL